MIFVYLLLAIMIGCIAGTITGITPGLHINLVSVMLLSVSPFLLSINGVDASVLACFIIAMSITHTFADFISAVYLGAPSEDTAISVLPGHRMLLEGRGYEAVKLTVVGSFLGLLSSIIFAPVLIIAIPYIYKSVSGFIGWILIGVVVFMILKDKGSNKKFWNFYTFIISGIFGIIVFNLYEIKEPLLPMLSGMFGISTLALSMSKKAELPKQRTTDMAKLERGELAKAAGSGLFSGSIVSIFPGLGPAQAAVIGTNIVGKISSFGFLVLVGGINTVSMVISTVTLLTIEKARNGSIIVIQKMFGTINNEIFILLMAASLAAGGIAVFLTLYVSRIFSSTINKINYNILSLIIIIFISALSIYFGGLIAFIVLFISTMIGLIPAITNVNRSNLMGCLLLPVIIYYIA